MVETRLVVAAQLWLPARDVLLAVVVLASLALGALVAAVYAPQYLRRWSDTDLSRRETKSASRQDQMLTDGGIRPGYGVAAGSLDLGNELEDRTFRDWSGTDEWRLTTRSAGGPDRELPSGVVRPGYGVAAGSLDQQGAVADRTSPVPEWVRTTRYLVLMPAFIGILLTSWGWVNKNVVLGVLGLFLVVIPQIFTSILELSRPEWVHHMGLGRGRESTVEPPTDQDLRQIRRSGVIGLTVMLSATIFLFLVALSSP